MKVRRIRDWRGISVRYMNAGELRSKRGSSLGFRAWREKLSSYNAVGWFASMWFTFDEGGRLPDALSDSGGYATPEVALNSAYRALLGVVKKDVARRTKMLRQSERCLAALERFKGDFDGQS